MGLCCGGEANSGDRAARSIIRQSENVGNDAAKQSTTPAGIREALIVDSASRASGASSG